MFCGKCGTELKDNAKFCSKCGNVIDANGKRRVNSQVEKYKEMVKGNKKNKTVAMNSCGRRFGSDSSSGGSFHFWWKKL